MGLGTRIRSARVAKGYSTTQLAYLLDRSAHTVIAYEAEKVTPAVSVIRDIAELLDITTDALIVGDDPS